MLGLDFHTHGNLALASFSGTACGLLLVLNGRANGSQLAFGLGHAAGGLLELRCLDFGLRRRLVARRRHHLCAMDRMLQQNRFVAGDMLGVDLDLVLCLDLVLRLVDVVRLQCGIRVDGIILDSVVRVVGFRRVGLLHEGHVDDDARRLGPVRLANALGRLDDGVETRDEPLVFSTPEQCTQGAGPQRQPQVPRVDYSRSMLNRC